VTAISPTVSVVIPTFQRRQHLSRVLEALSTQTVAPIEVIVVDASPGDDQLTEAETQPVRDWLVYLRGIAPGNVSYQRNLALRRCRGSVILFVDDDVEFGPELIEEHLRALETTGASAISGLILLPGEGTSTNPRRRFPHRIADPGAPNYQAFDGVIESYVICTANFSVRREAALAIGGFDEHVHGTVDDVEFGIRLARNGFRVVHHNGPRVLHLRVPGSGSRSAKMGFESGFQWMVANQFYYQFRHFPERKRRLLLASALWSHCRPSRHWLEPALIVGRVRSLFEGYRAAEARVRQPPSLLKG